MKKNIFLSMILILLLLVAYSQEEKKWHIFPQSEKKVLTSLLNAPEKIVSLGLSHLQMTKNTREKWETSEGQEILPDISEQILKHLSGISLIKEIPFKNEEEKQPFFAQTSLEFFVTKVDQQVLRLVLGDVIIATGNFYLLVGDPHHEKLFLAKDTSFFGGVYKNKVDQFLQKYLQLRNLLSRHSIEMIDRRIFSQEDLLAYDAFYMTSHENDLYIDFTQNNTVPKMDQRFSLKNLKRYISQRLIPLSFDKVMKMKGGGLKERQLLVEFKSEKKDSSKVLVLEVYNVFGPRRGLFLKMSSNPFVYEISQKTFHRLLLQRGDLIDKKIHWKVDFSKLDTLEFTLTFPGEKPEDFFVKDLEHFVIRSRNPHIKRINVKNFNFLFNLVLGLTEFKQANKIISRPKKIILQNAFTLTLLEKTLVIEVKEKEIIIFNKTDDFALFYNFDTSFLQVKKATDFFTY